MTVEAADQRLGTVAARGAAVTLASQSLRIVLQLASIAVLARLLTPRDYGLVAMVVAVVGVGEIFRDLGLSTAAVQSPSFSKAQRDNLFWASTALGLALLLVVLLSGHLIAAFYGHRELVGISRALSLIFLLNGAATQYRAGLNRRLQFGRLAIVDITAQVLGLACGLILAVNGSGYWALVAQQLVQGGVALALVIVAGRWVPGRPRRGVGMRPFFSFGLNVVGGQVINYAGRNTDALVIGYRFGAADLGTYNRAFQLLMVPLGQVRQPSTSVALPVLAKLQDQDRRYGEYLARGQLAFGYTLVVGLALAAGAARPVVALVLGDQWAGVVPLIRALAFAGMFETLAYVGFWAYLSRGLTRQLLRYSIVSSLLKASFVLIGSHWGVLGVAVGFAVGPSLDWPLSLWWLSRCTRLPMRRLIVGALRPAPVAVIGGALVTAVIATIPGTSALLQLTVALLTMTAVYAGAAVISRAVRQDLRDLRDIARRVLPSRISRSPVQ